jgi:hypothetical protein
VPPRTEDDILEDLLYSKEKVLEKKEDVTRAAETAYASLQDQAEEINALESGASIDVARKMIHRAAKRMHTDPGARLDKERALFSMYMTGRVDLLNKMKNHFRAQIEAMGGPKMSGTMDLTEGQERVAKKSRQDWYLRPDQAVLMMFREGGLETEDIADLMLNAEIKPWALKPELRKRYEERLAEPQRGPPNIRGEERSLAGKGLNLLVEGVGAAGAIHSGAKEGFLEPVLEATRDVSYEDPGKPPADLSEHPRLQGLAHAVKKSIPMSVLGAVSPPAALIAQATSGGEPAIPLEGPPPEFVGDVPDVMGTRPLVDLAMGKQVRYGGVPVKEGIERLVSGVPVVTPEKEGVGVTTKPGLFKAAAAGMLHGASHPLEPHARAEDIRRNVGLAKDKIESESRRLVQEETPGGSEAETQERAAQIARQLESADVMSLDPSWRQLSQEVRYDPSTYVGALNPFWVAGALTKKGVGAGARLGMKALKARAAAKGGEGIKDLNRLRKAAYGAARTVSATPEATVLDISAAGAKAPEQAEALRNVARGVRVAEDIGARSAEKLEPLRKLMAQGPKAKSEKSKALAQIMVQKMISRADDPPLKALERGAAQRRAEFLDLVGPEDVERQQKIGTEFAEIREEAGLGRYIDEATGELRERPLRENWMSTRERAWTPEREKFEQLFGDVRTRQSVTRMGAATSAHEKTDPLHALLDAAAQNEAEIRETGRRLPIHEKLQVARRVLEANDRIAVVPRPRVATVSRQLFGARKAVERLEKEAAKLAEEKLALRGRVGVAFETKDELETGARALKREGDPVWVQDREAKTAAKRVYSGQKRTLEKVAQEHHRTLVKLENARKAVAKLQEELPEAVNDMKNLDLELDRLTEEWGEDAVILSLPDTAAVNAGRKGVEPLADIFEIATGTVGESNTLTQTIIVPRPARQWIDAMTIGAGIRRDDGLQAVRDFARHFSPAVAYPMKGIVRPINRLWRMGKTVFFPPYHLMNSAGGFGIIVNAHGVRGLNPKLHKAAIQGALLSGGLFEEAMRAEKFRLRSGYIGTIGEFLDLAKTLGQMDLHKARLELGMPAFGPLDKVAKTVEETLGFLRPPGALGRWSEKLGFPKISPIGITRVTDNYMKFGVFLGFLNDPKNLNDVIRAADLTAEFAGNYNRMGSFEKSVMREGMGFYGWYRFILPRVLKSTFTHPGRMANVARGRQFLTERYGDQAVVLADAMGSWAREWGFPGPPGVQPEETRDPLLGTHQFAMGIMEDIQQMGFSLARQIMAPAGLDEDQGPAHFLGPIPQLIYESVVGIDLTTGRPIPELLSQEHNEFGLWKEGTSGARSEYAKKTVAGRFMWGFVERPSRLYHNVAQLYRREGMPAMTADMYMRLKAGQDLAGFDHTLAGFGYMLQQAGIDPGWLGFEAKSVGGFLDPSMPFVPARWKFEDSARNLRLDLLRGQRAKVGQ